MIARIAAEYEAPEFEAPGIDWYSFLERPRLRFPSRDRLDALREASILVTGAGGSIGGALSLRLASLGARRLVLLESSEQALYRLQSKLGGLGATPHITLGSVNDSALLNEIFQLRRPTLIFHAAAHKHVALLEEHPLAAIANNALGTLTLNSCSERFGSARIVLLSTDKAVAPSSILGAAKRIAEQITLSSGGVVARLANVLGSSGSVAETFCRQLASGGPITIADRDAERYFLTLEEAVDMLIYAAAGGSRSLFAPRLRRAQSIVSLAQFLCAARAPDTTVPFVFTGLRSGDKLRERLWSECDSPIEDSDADCLELLTMSVGEAQLSPQLAALQAAVQERDLPHAVAIVRQLVPDYSPSATVSALAEQSCCGAAQP